jgi:uncharacterized membrane protein YedE/YeeE
MGFFIAVGRFARVASSPAMHHLHAFDARPLPPREVKTVNDLALIVLYSGLVLGLVFGAVGLLSGFCLLSSLRGWWSEGDDRLIRTFTLAMAVAIVGTQGLAATGYVDLGKSIYLQASFSPALILFGGLIFGYGMVLANGCASRAVVLLGRGNLRSLVVVMVIAVAAEMTLKGLIAPARIAFLQWSTQTPAAISLPSLLASFGLGAAAQALAVLIVAGALLIFALSHVRFRNSPGQVAAGLIIGLLIAGGWLATGWLGADDFNPAPVASLTFIAPLADTLQYVMLSTGLPLSFGIALASGALAGSFVTSLITRRFQWEGFTSPGHMLRSVGGAALMGSGGAMAYGCSIGQGLTGVSTLALLSFVALAGIVLGAAAGLRGPLRVPALATSRMQAAE